MVRSALASVADELETSDDLTNGEETEQLGEDNTAGNELGRTDVADVVDDGLGRLEDAASAEGGPDVLVEALEGGEGAAKKGGQVNTISWSARQLREERGDLALTVGSSFGPGR